MMYLKATLGMHVKANQRTSCARNFQGIPWRWIAMKTPGDEDSAPIERSPTTRWKMRSMKVILYTNWTPIMQKHGALNPAFDPFRMEANKGLAHDYTPDMCGRTLDLLARTAYISVNPDSDEESLDSMIKALR